MIDLGIPGLRNFERIGAGGSASVFRAERDDGEIVAVKLLKWSLSSDNAAAQFERERQALDLLKDHPGIVSVLGSGLTDRGEPYLIMPMMKESAQAMLSDGPMPWRDAVDLTIDVADAIDFAHGNGLIHRDIKPANILIDHDGTPKIADFGVSKIVDMTQSASSDLVATPSFVPPERYSGTAASIRGDIYSLAATLWNLITGSAPFSEGEDANPLSVMRRALDDEPASLVEHGVSPAVDRVVSRAMSKDPAERPDTAADFAISLRSALTDDGEEPGEGKQIASGRQGGPVALATALIAGVALSAWALFAFTGDPETTTTATEESAITETVADEPDLEAVAVSEPTEVPAEPTALPEPTAVPAPTGCLIADVQVDTVVSQGECDTLAALYNATGGDQWVNATEGEDWMTPTDPCTWAGMKCDRGAIVKVDVRDMGLTGQIPASLVGLPELEQLILMNNGLTGEIPAGLSALTKLRRLILANNQLSGPLPAELAEFPELRDLYVENNGFTGEVPPELGNLSNLEDLFLSGNELTGPLPATIGNLSNLILLGAARNDFSGPVPDEIGNLTNLTLLSLSDNQFTSLPSSIGNLSNLVELKAAVNEIGEIPPEVGKLTTLDRLLVNNNNLTELPSEIGNLAALTRLEAEANNFTSLPDEIGNLTALTQVALKFNLLRGDITEPLRGAAASGAAISLADDNAGNECLTTQDPAVADWLNANDPGWDAC